MDPMRLLDSARDPFLRRQTAAMALSSLSSGQGYYTVESLEGATSLPLLKPAPSASLPRRESFLERDALSRLDEQTRTLFADRETLDARARLLAAEREALLLRNLPGGATSLTDRRARANTDGLQPPGARTRVSLDGLQNFDPGLENGSRVPPRMGMFTSGASNHGLLSGLLRPRELGAGARSRTPPFLAADRSLARRDIGDWRTDIRSQSGPRPFLPADPLLSRRNIADRRAEIPDVRAQNDRPSTDGFKEPVTMHSEPAEAIKAKKQAERNKSPSSSKPPFKSPVFRKKRLPIESEGWCAVCKIHCYDMKTLGNHVIGKKHKAVVEKKLQENLHQVNEASTRVLADQKVKSVLQADKKRASDTASETLQSAKRLKASASASVEGSAPTANATDVKKTDSKTVKPSAINVKVNASAYVCQVCNIFTTGRDNLETHLKGKRHAARVKELANSLETHNC